MKHLLTITALLISSLAMGQMPYNPDSNGDDLIGATDLISVLGLYNTLMVDSLLTCDYEGTEFESWVGGLFDGTLVLDSVYVEYLFSDSVVTFLPGCPDPVSVETVLDRSYMLTTKVGTSTTSFKNTYLGYARWFTLLFDENNGTYLLYVQDFEIDNLTGYSSASYWDDGSVNLPFSDTWTLDEDGIQVDWDEDDWVFHCEHFRLIPYWSEAE